MVAEHIIIRKYRFHKRNLSFVFDAYQHKITVDDDNSIKINELGLASRVLRNFGDLISRSRIVKKTTGIQVKYFHRFVVLIWTWYRFQVQNALAITLLNVKTCSNWILTCFSMLKYRILNGRLFLLLAYAQYNFYCRCCQADLFFIHLLTSCNRVYFQYFSRWICIR